MPLIDPVLKEILVCPNCHSNLVEDEAASTLTCSGCGLVFSVTDGIPNMLIEEARRPAGFVEKAGAAAAEPPAGGA